MLTALQLSRKILEETKEPMNPNDIWDYAVSKDYVKYCNLKGKTPNRTIGAQLYMDALKDNSLFYKYSSKPPKFGLISLKDVYPASDNMEKRDVPHIKLTYTERDLHPLLVSYLYSDERFHANAKTIFHEKSQKAGKNAEKWLHPDIVAVHYAFQDLEKDMVDLATKVGESVIRIYSFELKKEITSDAVREYYFQAVSNSSWANEGYLVAPSITEDAFQQLEKLNSSFGIGFIKLNLEDVYQSEVMIPSRDNESLDLGLMDELTRLNPDFKKFIQNINKSLKTDEVVRAHYDEVLDQDELDLYIKEKHMV